MFCDAYLSRILFLHFMGNMWQRKNTESLKIFQKQISRTSIFNGLSFFSDVFFPLRLFGPFSLEHLAASLELLYSLEVYYCRSENLQISLSSNKDNIRNVSHYNSIYFLSYVYPRYIKRLFTNMQKQQNKLKNSLLLI